ncbi:hypothetical protein [Vagococcus xieshaowenii]|uniref:Uncharacterized protein n=1 Tax=Vagococcus xieshaowenii TaxID=2562451 RepID=A0AAJ5EE93_9ENTE|nr:hypothetical protein [Vagococcus xieshaowenii]QCA28096.1 hypothetical protein E4Z98_01755 [Vagococcus xieshaowenii]TFZ40139.1 hypothetical protein E4031_08080 [Vagococcus xieshaowenii]
MLKKSTYYRGIVLLESLVSLGLIVVLTMVILPLLTQLKKTEASLNDSWKKERYLYEVSRDKCLLPDLKKQRYIDNHQSYLVKVKSNDVLITEMSIHQENNVIETVNLIEKK